MFFFPPEIPGFYYDPEKKRYFKLAPNHASATCNYTPEELSKKKAEEKRKNDVSKIISGAKKNDLDKSRKPRNLIPFLMNQNGYRKNDLRVQLLKNCVCSLKPVGSQSCPEMFDYSHDYIKHTSFMHMGQRGTELLCLWTVKACFSQRIQLLEIVDGKRTQDNPGPLVVSARPILNPVRGTQKVCLL